MTRIFSYHCLALILVAASTQASEANVPVELYSKTIVISFSLIPPPGAGSAQPGPLAIQRLIYVSSKGQVFVRGSRSAGTASDSKDVSPGTYRYEGGRIVGFYTMASHANQIAIRFDPGFQSCNASMQFGKSGG